MGYEVLKCDRCGHPMVLDKMGEIAMCPNPFCYKEADIMIDLRMRYTVTVTENGVKLMEYSTYHELGLTIGSLLSEVQASLARIVATDTVVVHFEVRRVA